MTNEFYSGTVDIQERVEGIRQRMAAAALRAGRKPEEVTLLGVTKTQSAAAVRALLQAGVTEIGENRVQELIEKAPHLEDIPHKTHLIGHLQRNKAKFLPGLVDMVQSIDSVKTVEALEKAYAKTERPLDVLIEVNIGAEAGKTGVSKEGLLPLAQRVLASPCLRLRGLMAIPPFFPPEQTRPFFREMHNLFIDISAQNMDNNTVNILSMGMSADFEAAIEEGATMVRVGTDLFGPRV